MHKRPIFTAALILVLGLSWRALSAYQDTAPATPPAPPQPPAATEVPPSDPDSLAMLVNARGMLYEHSSIQANVSQTVALSGYEFQGVGKYVAGTGLKHRLEYTFDLGDLTGYFLEVSNGTVLHTQRKITQSGTEKVSAASGESDFRRRDIQRIREALRKKIDNADDPAAIRNLEMGLGGLTAMMASLERTLILEPAKPETVDGKSYQMIQGRLNQVRANELLSAMGPTAGQIAAFFPELVRIYLAADTLFPERILYLEQLNADTYRPVVLVEFSDVVLNQPLAANAFDYSDPGAVERDETDVYLQMLGVDVPAGQAPPQNAAPSILPISPLTPPAESILPPSATPPPQ